MESAEVSWVLIAPKIGEIELLLNDPTGAASSPLPSLYDGRRLFTQTLTRNKYNEATTQWICRTKITISKHTKNNKTLTWAPLFPSL